MDGINIVGVQFRRAGRIYDFSTGGADLKVGDDVVVDTERGPSLAKVAVVRYEVREGRSFGRSDAPDGEPGKSLKPIMRVASNKDLDDTRRLTPEAAVSFARDRCEKQQLKMSVLQADVQFGGNKVIIYFSAPGRVDFRELVKDLASGLKARVELKQVGSRDEAKLVGGLGICGREFCCSSFLREFVPVSIKMAKNQNLALNPSKVSGGCGRLLCCLTYENDLYTELRKKLPPRGTRVRSLEDGSIGDVVKGDILNQALFVVTEEGRFFNVKLKDVEFVDKNAGRPQDDDGDSEAETWGEDLDMAALAGLDDEVSSGKAPSSGGNQERGDRGPRGRGDRGPRGGNDRGGGPQGQRSDRGAPRNDRGPRGSGDQVNKPSGMTERGPRQDRGRNDQPSRKQDSATSAEKDLGDKNPDGKKNDK